LGGHCIVNRRLADQGQGTKMTNHMKMFAPSPFQADFFRWIEQGRGSAVLIAVAGSGKSTTIVQALRCIPERQRVLVLAFNAAIVREMAAKVREEFPAKLFDFGTRAGNVQVATFHSVGFSAVCKHLGKKSREVETDGGKLRKLFQQTVGDIAYDLYGEFVTRLVALAKGEGIGALIPDEPSVWRTLVAHHDLYLDSDDADENHAIELARGLLMRSNEAAHAQAWIDFDDQIYLPILWRLRLWQHDWVFIDEAQDTNPVRRAIAKLALSPGGRLVAVGDPHQSIYGFTGATHDAIDLIKREFAAVELPLTVSYRCPKEVAALARTIVPAFTAHDAASDGSVVTLPLLAGLARLDSHDVVLCRNVAPLIDLAFQLIASGRGCTVLGKEIGAGLVNLVKKQRARGISNLLAKLDLYRDREVAKHTAKGEEGKAEAVVDRVACIATVIASMPETERTIPALVARIEGMFSDTNGVLTLSTAHKAKGREWRRVAILRPELMPSKWARQDWQQVQEQNLIYVAWTRTKDELIFLSGESK
jgi:DNA helicase II / ATP-dependent DNA helicase PcrA